LKEEVMTKELRKRILWLAFSHVAALTIGIAVGRVFALGGAP
jgi:hypothetical protein